MIPEPTTLEEPPLITLPPEVLPNLEQFVIDDGKPVENVFTEKQQRLLTESLHSSWAGPGEGRPWVALADVGLFYAEKQPPLVPDMMLGVDVEQGSDLSQKANRSYFVWLRGKVPDLAVEIISDIRGGETTHKMLRYASLRITYYVILDPENLLGEGVLRVFGLQLGAYQPISPDWMPPIGLGLKLWEGQYEDMHALWLRWCDEDGSVIPTGHEKAEKERDRADRAEQHARQAERRARQAEQRTSQAEQENERLRAQLRALGMEPTPPPD